MTRPSEKSVRTPVPARRGRTPVAARRGRPPRPDLARALRERILDAAARQFAAGGYHATDLQAIADELDLGKGTLYRHFPSKEALFLAAVDRAMHGLREHVERARAPHADPLDQIAAAIVAYLHYFDRRPEYVELLILERAVFRQRRTPTYFEHRRRNVRPWRELYRRLIAAGRVRALPPNAITDVLSSALYGTMFTNYFAGRRKSLERQAAQLIEVLYGGILTPRERELRARRAAATPAVQLAERRA